MNGGDRVAEVLKAQGVKFLFTLCGGHIAPILVGAKARGIRVVDTRHEVNAVFAADAVARMTGTVGVAAVTAGPGATNTITAVKNAQLAQSPIVVLIGAAATVLKGRGSLQDIDQESLFHGQCKKFFKVLRVKDLAISVEEAFETAKEGVPGPCVVECPIDLLFPEALVREWYGAKGGAKAGAPLGEQLLAKYLDYHVKRVFKDADAPLDLPAAKRIAPPAPSPSDVSAAVAKLSTAERPVMLVGSGAMLEGQDASAIAAAVEKLGIPTYLSGSGRGLLGASNPTQVRHKRREALKEADLVILAGVPADFRLDYGRHIRGSTFLISVNRSREDRTKNRRPQLGVAGDPGLFLRALAATGSVDSKRWSAWSDKLRGRDAEREREIDKMAGDRVTGGLNPVEVCRAMEHAMSPETVMVADGGDFVATASYIVHPRSPLSWLDPGVFGTLGVGGGFALGAKLVRPESEVWVIYGDGSVGYSLVEFDTFVRHNTPVIAVVGNDGAWMQILRDQIEILKDDVAVVLRQSDYHVAAQGLGGHGILVTEQSQLPAALAEAKAVARSGKPVLVNVHIGKTEFRKGSISM